MTITTNIKLCPVGRPFDENHVTCRSCRKQGNSCSSSKKRRVPEPPRSWTRGTVFVTTKALHSMNHWHGRPAYVYQKYKNEWRKVLSGTWALWGVAAGKRSLIVTRYVASQGHLIKDDDNLSGARKPLQDVLVEMGILLDDNREVATCLIQQFIDRENPRTEIEVNQCA